MYSLFLLGFSILYSSSFEDLGEGILIQRNQHLYNNEKKIAIVTVIISGSQQEHNKRYKHYNFKKVVSFGTKSKELYAKKYGHDFIIATKKINNCYGVKAKRKLECAWTKLAVISRVLEDYDWVFWTDADSVILNFDIKLEDFLNEDFDVIACAETEFDKPEIFKGFINTGQVFYKNCDFCKELILGAWNNHHKKTPGSFEQARINNYIIETNSAKRVLVHPPRSFNSSLRQFELGDFIVHMYACHGEKLYFRFKEYEKKYSWILDKEKKLTK
jgi:hypothetical protein